VSREGDRYLRGGSQLVLPPVAELAEGRISRALGGHGSRGPDRPRGGFATYLDQLTLVAVEGKDAVDEDRSPRMSELPNPFRVPMFATDHRRAADTRFFRGRGLLQTEWSAEILWAPKSFDLYRWLPPVPDWEPNSRSLGGNPGCDVVPGGLVEKGE